MTSESTALKFRKQHHQHAQPVHGAQSGAGMRRHQDSPEVRPHLRRILRPLPQAGQRRFDASFGFGCQLQAVTSDKFKQAKQHGWILDRRKLAQKNPAFDHGKIGIGQARFAIFEQSVQARSRRRHFIEQHREPVNRPNVPEVGSHPGRGRDRRSPGSADSGGRRFGLQFVGQLFRSRPWR